MKCKHIYLIVVLLNFNRTAINQSIPTKQEQANLLLNVQEVFEEVKHMIEEEAENTDSSFKQDIVVMVKRAEYILGLLEEITLLRLSCKSNSVCMLGYRPIIKEIAAEGKKDLQSCITQTSTKIEVCQSNLSNVTSSALERGQLLLDDLGECSRKNGLAVVPCYKKIIATDVVPVKLKLLEAIEAHKKANSEILETRKVANMCVDENLKKYRDLMEKALKDAILCK